MTMYHEETAIIEQIKRSEEIERRRKGREQEWITNRKTRRRSSMRCGRHRAGRIARNKNAPSGTDVPTERTYEKKTILLYHRNRRKQHECLKKIRWSCHWSAECDTDTDTAGLQKAEGKLWAPAAGPARLQPRSSGDEHGESGAEASACRTEQ